MSYFRNKTLLTTSPGLIYDWGGPLCPCDVWTATGTTGCWTTTNYWPTDSHSTWIGGCTGRWLSKALIAMRHGRVGGRLFESALEGFSGCWVVEWKERVLNNGELLCVTVWDALKRRQRTREYNMWTRTWGEEHLSVGGWRWGLALFRCISGTIIYLFSVRNLFEISFWCNWDWITQVIKNLTFGLGLSWACVEMERYVGVYSDDLADYSITLLICEARIQDVEFLRRVYLFLDEEEAFLIWISIRVVHSLIWSTICWFLFMNLFVFRMLTFKGYVY